MSLVDNTFVLTQSEALKGSLQKSGLVTSNPPPYTGKRKPSPRVQHRRASERETCRERADKGGMQTRRRAKRCPPASQHRLSSTRRGIFQSSLSFPLPAGGSATVRHPSCLACPAPRWSFPVLAVESQLSFLSEARWAEWWLLAGPAHPAEASGIFFETEAGKLFKQQ